MREDLAEIVHPVLNYGLMLRDELNRSAQLDFYQVQQDLMRLLKSESEARRWPEYGRSGAAVDVSLAGGASLAGGDPQRGGQLFLGIRYALTCWLDELLIKETPWGQRWNEQKLEDQLYKTNMRATLFWEQAKRAEGRSSDALEVFFLCVTLGFRGDLRESREKLDEWYNATQARIINSQPQRWGGEPTDAEPITNVPPLTGREALQRMLMLGAAVFLILIPAVVIAAVYKLG
jgi:type VI secretion system protein ImpK